MAILIRLILSEVEVAALVILLMVILLIIVCQLLRKHVVTVPSMTLNIDKTTYDHGETVDAQGKVLSDVDKPAAGVTVDLKLTDSTETDFPVGSVTTGDDGTYASSFAVPDAVAPGGVTVTATVAALGISARQTFRLRS